MIRTNVLLLGLVFCVQCLAAPGQQTVCHRPLADAQKQAAKDGRTMLIHVAGYSCSVFV
ncbi:MAG: hypothetical protein ACK55P_22340 [Planctomyces sp.]